MTFKLKSRRFLPSLDGIGDIVADVVVPICFVGASVGGFTTAMILSAEFGQVSDPVPETSNPVVEMIVPDADVLDEEGVEVLIPEMGAPETQSLEVTP